MKVKNEKGVVSVDYITAVILFIFGSVAVLALYYNVYTLKVKIKIDETIIGYMTEICETIDLKQYEEVDTVQEITQIIQSAKIPSEYNVVCEGIENYKDSVEKIKFKITYTLKDITRDFELNKVKVKE